MRAYVRRHAIATVTPDGSAIDGTETALSGVLAKATFNDAHPFRFKGGAELLRCQPWHAVQRPASEARRHGQQCTTTLLAGSRLHADAGRLGWHAATSSPVIPALLQRVP